MVNLPRLDQKHDVAPPPQPAPTTERSGKKKPRRKSEKKRKDEPVDKAIAQPQPAQSGIVPNNAQGVQKEADSKKEAELDHKIELIRIRSAQSEARHNEVMADKARAKEQEETDRRAGRRDDANHGNNHHRRSGPGPNLPRPKVDNADHGKKYPPSANAEAFNNGQPQQHHQPPQQHNQGPRYNNNYHSHSNNSTQRHTNPHSRPVKAYVPTQQSRSSATPAIPNPTPPSSVATNGR